MIMSLRPAQDDHLRQSPSLQVRLYTFKYLEPKPTRSFGRLNQPSTDQYQ